MLGLPATRQRWFSPSHAFTPAYCRYSFVDPGRMKGWVDLGGWLYRDGLPRQQTVTHPSINRARRRVTPLIETSALSLNHSTPSNQSTCEYCSFCWRIMARASYLSNLVARGVDSICRRLIHRQLTERRNEFNCLYYYYHFMANKDYHYYVSPHSIYIKTMSDCSCW